MDDLQVVYSRTNRAFFSYARADHQLAMWLWRKLDRYKTPRELLDAPGALGPVPAKLHPIFRDREDLASRGKTFETILAALEDSDALIVLCTPNSATSEWVNKEIVAFQAFNPARRIYPVIGTSKPEADRNRPIEDYLPKALKNSELLAADLREFVMPGGNIVGDGKQGGSLKLIAGLLGVPLDKLVRRERVRQRRTIFALAATAITFAGVAAAAVILGLLADRNADRAQEQSDRSLALLLSSQSRNVLKKNDQRALLLAVEAAGATASHGYISPSARTALEQSLSRVTGVGLSGHRDNVVLAEFSENEQTLATAAFNGEVRLWDVKNPDSPRLSSILHLPEIPQSLVFDQAGNNLVTLSGTGSSKTNALVWPLHNTGKYPASRPLFDDALPDYAMATSQQLIAVAGDSDEVHLVSRADLSHTTVQRVLQAPIDSEIIKLAFSSDGNILLAGTRASRVLIWDLNDPGPEPVADIFADHQVPPPVPSPAKVDILGISDDHSSLFTASSEWFDNSTWADLNLKLWRLHELRPIGPPTLLPHLGAPNSSAIQAARFIGTGNDLVTVSLDGRVRSWRAGGAQAEQKAAESFMSGEFVSSADMSADGKLFALAAGGEVQMLHLSDMSNSANAINALKLPGFDGSVKFVHFSASAKLLVAGGLDGTARLWNLYSGDPSAFIPVTRPSPYAPAQNTTLSDDGTFAVVLTAGTLEFWNLHAPLAPQLMRSVEVDSARLEQIGDCLGCTVRVSPDQQWAAIQTAERNRAEILELTPNGRSLYVNTRVWSGTNEVTFSPNGRWLLAQEDGAETIYDLSVNAPGIPSRTLVNLPPGSYSRTLSPDSKYVLYERYLFGDERSIGRDQKVGVLAPLEGINELAKRREIKGFSTGIGNAVFSADGQWLALAGESSYPDRSEDDTTIELLRVDNPTVAVMTLSGSEFTTNLQFSGDSRWLLSGSEDSLLRGTYTQTRLWLLDANNAIPTPQPLPGVVTYLHAATLSPDGQFLMTISGAAPTARLWKLTDQVTLAATLIVPKPILNWHYKINFSKDGKVLIVAGTDSPTPYLWRLDSTDIPSRGTPIPNGDRDIKSIDFSADSKHLIIMNSGQTTSGVSGTTGSHVTMVDLETFPQEGSLFQTLETEDADQQAAYRQDVGFILAQGKSIRAGLISVAKMLERAERATGRNLTLEEWIKTETSNLYQPTFSRLPVDAQTLEELPGIIARLRSDDPQKANRLTSKLVDWTRQLDEAEVCNSVAWEFSQQLDGQAALDSVSCALSQFPDNENYRDTRGLAYALLGRRDEAIADFEFFVRVQSENPANTQDVESRQQWIHALQAGKNPFEEPKDSL